MFFSSLFLKWSIDYSFVKKHTLLFLCLPWKAQILTKYTKEFSSNEVIYVQYMSSGRPRAVVQSAAPSLGWTLLTGQPSCLSLRDPWHREACQQHPSSLPLLVQLSPRELYVSLELTVHMLEVFNISSLLTSFFFRELLLFFFFLSLL